MLEMKKPWCVATRGITLVELAIAILIAALIIGTGVPGYFYIVNKARTERAIEQVKEMSRDIDRFRRKNFQYPDSLSEIYSNPPVDPWGNTYKYLKITNASNPGSINPRIDDKLKPLNVDYDLFSEGRDTQSLSPIGASESRDDIIRGKNGDFIGIATDY